MRARLPPHRANWDMPEIELRIDPIPCLHASRRCRNGWNMSSDGEEVEHARRRAVVACNYCRRR